MTGEDVGRLGLTRLPDGDASILPARGNAPIAQECHGIEPALVEAQDRTGGAGAERPTNGRGVEAARDQLGPVARERQGAHWPAVAAQLRLGRRLRDSEEQKAKRKTWFKHGGSKGIAGSLPTRRQARPSKGTPARWARLPITATSAPALQRTHRSRRARSPARQSADRPAGRGDAAGEGGNSHAGA